MRQVRSLDLRPKLAIVQTIDSKVINTYVRLKGQYGEDIGVDVEKHFVEPGECIARIKELNNDESVNGIIVQLPLDDTLNQKEVLNTVAKDKDVDGLSDNSPYDPATPIAIMWLLSGFNIETRGKTIGIIGQGPLVGAPLKRIYEDAGNEILVSDKDSGNVGEVVGNSDIIVSATGQPGLVTEAMINENSVVIDAGVAVASGKTVGDLSDDVYERDDLVITPKKGGVGPLTVCALFENVIKAASS